MTCKLKINYNKTEYMYIGREDAMLTWIHNQTQTILNT